MTETEFKIHLDSDGYRLGIFTRRFKGMITCDSMSLFGLIMAGRLRHFDVLTGIYHVECTADIDFKSNFHPKVSEEEAIHALTTHGWVRHDPDCPNVRK